MIALDFLSVTLGNMDRLPSLDSLRLAESISVQVPQLRMNKIHVDIDSWPILSVKETNTY